VNNIEVKPSEIFFDDEGAPKVAPGIRQEIDRQVEVVLLLAESNNAHLMV